MAVERRLEAGEESREFQISSFTFHILTAKSK
jgi:hypothetical protein